MKNTSQSRSLQFVVTGALLMGAGGAGGRGDLACALPEDPDAIEDELTAQTAGEVVVNAGPANPPRPITGRAPGVVNPGPVTEPATMR